MATSRRNKITANWYDTLTNNVNELFGDTHEGEGPNTDTQVQDNLRWGWGGANVYVPPVHNKVTAEHTDRKAHV